MITVLTSIVMLALIALPFFKRGSKPADKTVVYKNDTDTTHAHYAINDRGYLEEISGNKVHGNFID
ncbi:hypothetical protein HQ865_03920 [Mucilaginibacter mali]|uniref:Uncharacterized protein n=1 Tax=Mucilaginibacter mali TaxID=2740462 RepID=A0A7D4TTE4_9SPHI|nr:hypothetical protein [Mucilaginibacter mali]QKJ28935.1 hypothetical protein HQ865_03920 [Mucilaginibacter mali]